MKAERLKSVGTLLTETWEEYKVRALPMLGVLLLGSVLLLLAVTVAGLVLALAMGGVMPLLAQMEGGRLPLPVLMPIVGVLFVVSSLCILWVQSAVLAITVDGELGITGALGVGWRRMWSLGWVLLLAGGIILAGSLLIVPALVFSVWFVFAAFALYAEDRRGLDALFASRGCVRGHFWNTFFKLLLVWLLSVLIGLVPLVGQLLSFLFIPFGLLFMMAMYRDLRRVRGERDMQGSRLFWGGLAAIGLWLVGLGLVGAAVSLAPQLPGLMRQYHHPGRPMMEHHPGRPGPQRPSDDQRERAADKMVPLRELPGQAMWRDPEGDVAAGGVSPWLDIGSVTATGSNGSLVVDVRLHRPMSGFFTAAAGASSSFAPLLTLYLDTDVDRATGAEAAGGSGRDGYDLAVAVVLEADPAVPARGRVHVSIYRLQEGRRVSLAGLPVEDITPGRYGLELRLPYRLLGLRQGARLRLCFRENAQVQGSGLSRDSLITLE